MIRKPNVLFQEPKKGRGREVNVAEVLSEP